VDDSEIIHPGDRHDHHVLSCLCVCFHTYFLTVILPVICSLFNGAIGNSGYTTSNDWMSVNNNLRNYMEGSGRDLISGTIVSFDR
jgi:hypothetical protein